MVHGRIFQGHLADSSEAIQLNRQTTPTPSSSGAVAMRTRGEYDKAIVELNAKTIRLMPGSLGAYTWRGVAYGVKGVFERALADYTEVKLASSYGRPR